MFNFDFLTFLGNKRVEYACRNGSLVGARAGIRVPFIECSNEKTTKQKPGIAQRRFIREGLAPLFNFLHCYIPFLTEKVHPSYTHPFTHLVLKSSLLFLAVTVSILAKLCSVRY